MSLLSLFKKKNNRKEIAACVSGELMDITSVNDSAFSNKLMGDGVAIKPEGNIICSPCTGKISMMFPTCHAFGITADSGVEVLVHIGIDTVNLQGNGFKAFVKRSDSVKCGDPIIEFDPVKVQDYDMSTMIILAKNPFPHVTKILDSSHIKKGEPVIKVD